MIDGTYNIVAHTPLGDKEGTAVLTTKGTICQAHIDVAGITMDSEAPFENGSASFEGTAKFPFPIGNVDYTLDGTIDGDDLKATFTGKGMTFDITGSRVAE